MYSLCKRVVPAVAALCLLGIATDAKAGSPYGNWLRPATGVIVKVFPCGGGVGVKVLKSSVPSRIGKVYMCGAKLGRNGTFRGKLKNPEDNGTYAGRARLINASQMKLSGCIPHTVLCRSEVWRRIR